MKDQLNFSDRTGVIELSSAHSIILPNRPPIVKGEDFNKLITEDPHSEVESFGLFETSTPNYTTYYPDATAEDLDPSDDEFITPTFRLLSKVIVSKFRPIDFGKGNVLRDSMRLLLGQTINIDHEVAVGNAIGSISEVSWQNTYKTKSGIVVPAGINGVLKIDGKSNPRIARGINMNPPSIHSNSVTVRFEWEPSHKFKDENDFYRLVGTYNDKGELIRAIVTKVIAYHETSLVSHGADRFAQKVNSDGQIVNPEYAETVKQFSAEKPLNVKAGLDYKNNIIGLSLDSTIPSGNNNKGKSNTKTTKMNELKDFLVNQLGFKSEDLTDENLIESLTGHVDDLKDQLSTLTTEKEDLDGQVSTLESDKGELEKKFNSLDEKYKELEKSSSDLEGATAEMRTEAVKFYKLCKGDDADEKIVKLMETAKFDVIKSLLTEYRKEADEKFGYVCNDCESNNVSRKSADTSDDGLTDEGGKGGKPEGSKNIPVRERLKNKAKKQRNIYRKYEKKEDK